MEDELECSIPVARGGPIYVSNMVASVTRVPLFQESLQSELESLEAELPQDSSTHDLSYVTHSCSSSLFLFAACSPIYSQGWWS